MYGRRVLATRLFLVLSYLFSCMLIGCGTSNVGTLPVPEAQEQKLPESHYPGVVRENVVLLDSATTQIVPAGEDKVTLRGGTDNDNIEPGTVLVSAEGEGMLRKVVEVLPTTGESDSVTVRTEQATLLDLFQEADVDHQQALSFDDVESFTPAFEGVQLVPMTEKELTALQEEMGDKIAALVPPEKAADARLGYGFKIVVESISSDLVPGVSYGYELGFFLGFEFILDIGVDWYGFIPVPYLEHFRAGPLVEGNASLAINLDLAESLGLTVEDSLPLGELESKEITIMIGSIPLVLKLVLEFELTLSAGFEANLEISMGASFSISKGVEYIHDRGWGWCGETTNDTWFDCTNLNVGGFAEIALQDSFMIQIYDVAGPYIAVKAPYIRAEAELTFFDDWHPKEVEFSVDVGISMAIGFKVEFLDITWLDVVFAETDILGPYTLYSTAFRIPYPETHVRGRTLDDQGNPIPGVSVQIATPNNYEIMPDVVLTDSNGNWEASFIAAPGGDYPVKYEKLGWHKFDNGNVHAAYGDPSNVNLGTVVNQPVVVSGQTLDETASALPGVTVAVRGPSVAGNQEWITTSDADGSWMLSEVPNTTGGGYSTTYYIHGRHFIQPQPFAIDFNDYELPEAVGKPNIASGRILDNQGLGLGGVGVSIRGRSCIGEYTDSTVTDSSGDWGIELIPNSEGTVYYYSIEVDDPGWRFKAVSGKDTFKVANNNNAGFSHLGTPNRVFGIVEDAEESGLAGALITVTGSNIAGDYFGQAYSGDDGSWEVVELPNTAGDGQGYTLTIEYESGGEGLAFFPPQKSFTIFDCDYNAGLFGSRPMYSASGTVVDYLGNPVENTVIRLAGANTGQALSDATGYWSVFCALKDDRDYRVTPELDGWWFAPEFYSFHVYGASETGLEFQGAPCINQQAVGLAEAPAGIGTEADPYVLEPNSAYTVIVLDTEGDNIATYCTLESNSPWYELANGDQLQTFEVGPLTRITASRAGDPNSPAGFWVMVWE